MSQLSLPLMKTVVNPNAGTSICEWRRKPSGDGHIGDAAEQGMASQAIGLPRASINRPVGCGEDACLDDNGDKGGGGEGLVRMTTRTLRCCSKELYTMTGRSEACSLPSAEGSSTQPVNAFNWTAVMFSESGAWVNTPRFRAKSWKAASEASAS